MAQQFHGSEQEGCFPAFKAAGGRRPNDTTEYEIGATQEVNDDEENDDGPRPA